MKRQKAEERLCDDTHGASPVIGVIMMIAVAVIITAVIAVFAYGVLYDMGKVPCTAIVFDGVIPGTNVNVTITHHGGDILNAAFTTTPCSTDLGDKWQDLELRYNGARVSSSNANNMWLNGVEANNTWHANFVSGDVLKIQFKMLKSGDSIMVVHGYSSNVLRRVMVV